MVGLKRVPPITKVLRDSMVIRDSLVIEVTNARNALNTILISRLPASRLEDHPFAGFAVHHNQEGLRQAKMAHTSLLFDCFL